MAAPHPTPASPLAEVKVLEREWQNATGWTFQEDAWSRAGTRLVIERQFQRIGAALAPAPDDRVLELGCGVGHLIRWLDLHAPARYVGIDLSIATARAALDVNPERGFSAAEAERLPFHDASFDRVVCNGSGHHFLDLTAAMREAYRVLKPGGRLVVFEPIATPFANAVRGALLSHSRFESPVDLARKHDFSRAIVERTLTEAGFADVSSHLHDFLAYPLSGMYIELPWSRSRAVMGGIAGLEAALARITPLRPLLDQFAWRLLVVATRPH